MGVTSFFWWFLNKYPKTLSSVQESRGEFDNFYIDLNEIIHPTFHSKYDLFPPPTFDEIFSILYHHIDRLLDIVRPRNLLFIAIDGVASWAKMYPIRSGRFGSASSRDMKWEIGDKLREEFLKEGKSTLSKEESQGLDSSVITPGTEFMHLLSEKLQRYICQRMSGNSAWENIKVILSDDKVPGEGEHKIMSFIRAQRASPGYDPNTSHCVYGTDTDLIMLALATHEVHFSILREEPVGGVVKTQFLNVCVLREYLSLDLEIPHSDQYGYDLERIIDDFIFICFFAGNDFLPKMRTLKTHEGCIDLLMHVYKKEFQSFGGYLVDMQKAEDETGGYINFKGVERFMLTVGKYEDKIFSTRSQIKDRKLRRTLEDSRNSKNSEKDHQVDERVSRILASYAIVDNADGIFRNTVELLQKVKDNISCRKDLLEADLRTDYVKLGTHGWRERYYKKCFSAETPEEIEAKRKYLVAEYCKGLCWVLLCYFSGVPSWSWFHPYRCACAPFASEFQGLSQIKVEFQKGLPLKPFDQLMGVLPPSRAHLLPEAYKEFMIDKNSKLADFFYPKDGELYILEEECLLSVTKKLEKELKDHEKVRNTETLDLLFVKRSSQQAVWCSGSRAASNKIKGAVMMRSNIEGIQGMLHMMPEDLVDADEDNKEEYSRNVLCMFYETHQDLGHVPQLLEGINIPQMTVKKEDVVENILWHERYGNGSNRSQNRQHQKWDHPSESAGSWRRDGGGSGSGRESDTSLRPSSNNKPRQGGNSFWQSRSDADDWRSNKQSVAAPAHKNSVERHSEGSSRRW